MKPKKLSKKLTLNKSTIADLNGNEMIKVKGGTPWYSTAEFTLCIYITCPRGVCGIE